MIPRHQSNVRGLLKRKTDLMSILKLNDPDATGRIRLSGGVDVAN